MPTNSDCNHRIELSPNSGRTFAVGSMVLVSVLAFAQATQKAKLPRLDVLPENYVSSNKEDTIFKGRLYWPVNNSAFQVRDEYNWEKFMADPSNPKYGGRLPYYGSVSPIEVNDDINAVWNMTKGLRHIPGEKLASISKRIQDPITAFIKQKDAARIAAGLPPMTKAHKTVIRAAGNDTFVAMNMHPGDNRLASGPIREPSPGGLTSGRTDKECQWALDVAQQVLNLEDPQGGCKIHTGILIALHQKAHIFSIEVLVECRPANWRGGYVEGDQFPDGDNWLHAIVCLPLESNDDQRGRSKGYPGFRDQGFSDRVACVLSDPTAYAVGPFDRARFRVAEVVPFPEHFLVSGKGDTVLRMRWDMEYMDQNLTYTAQSTRQSIDWTKGSFYKADVSSVNALIDGGNRLSEQILAGK